MALDPYELCPAGSGKKMKFCCPKLIGDYDKLFGMMSEQQGQAMRMIDRLLEKNGPTQCLLDCKAGLQLRREDFDGARTSIGSILELQPGSPTALAMLSIVESKQRNIRESIDAFQRAILAAGDHPPPIFEAAAQGIGLACLELGRTYVPTAVAHLTMAVMHRPGGPSTQLLMQILSEPDVPSLLKTKFAWRPLTAPSGEPVPEWHEAYNRAADLNGKHLVSAAIEELKPWLDREDAPYDILWMGAWLQAFLGQPDQAVATLRRISHADRFSLETRTEAEAIAGLLDATETLQNEDAVVRSYAITDPEKLRAALIARTDLVPMPVDREAYPEGEPVPQDLFLVLSGPKPTGGAGEANPASVQVIGPLEFYGKRTDRDAQLRARFFRIESDEGVINRIVGELGDRGLGGVVGEEATPMPRNAMWITDRLFFGEEVTKMVADQHQARQVRETLLGPWLDWPDAAFGGKSPREAVSDPQLRVQVAGWLAMLETANLTHLSPEDLAAARDALGIPQPESLAADKADVYSLTPWRMLHLDLASLDDEQLSEVYGEAVASAYSPVVIRAGRAVLERPSLHETYPKVEVYEAIISNTYQSWKVQPLLDEARDACGNENDATARLDLLEYRHLVQSLQGKEALMFGMEMLQRYGDRPEIAAPVAESLDHLTGGRLSAMHRQQMAGMQGGMLPPEEAEPSRFMLNPPSQRPSSGGGGLILPD